jgi:hypothetical protein
MQTISLKLFLYILPYIIFRHTDIKIQRMILSNGDKRITSEHKLIIIHAAMHDGSHE